MIYFTFLQATLIWIALHITTSLTDICEECDSIHYTNSWAVHIEDGDLEVASNIAKRHGFVNKGQIGSLPGYYHFIHESTTGGRRHRRALDRTELLLSEKKVKWVEQQQVLERDKRSVIPDFVGLAHPAGIVIQDPLFKDQWYLNNIGQSSGPPSLDINILPVWARGITGKNVVVAVLDDGLDHTHPDLVKNYDPRASYDFNDYDNDPMPRVSDPNNCHGTKCAGEVAAEAGNGVCGVGVAYNASIGGIRMLDGNTTDTIEGSALSYHNNYISIYSCAWGPKDDGKRFGRPGTLASKALELGTREGRGGLGSIFVWATGNGGLTDDDCNCDGYTTSIFTVSIGAISDHGLSTYYTESCASTLAVTYSGGSHREKKENKIITTTLNHECTDEFKGTSSAAPLAAGMIALMLEANPKLSWRDIQHIIVETALMTSPLDEGWRRNGAGKWFNQKFGFGRIDASQLVERSIAWDNVAEQRKCWGDRSEGPWSIPESGTLLVSANTSACADTPLEIRSLEHVQLVLSLKHRHRGHLSIELISPSGTRSHILKTRRNDKSNKGLKDWVFMSVHFWGEDPRGTWTLAITDNDENTRQHYLLKAKHGDFEDATESLQDEMMGKGAEKDGLAADLHRGEASKGKLSSGESSGSASSELNTKANTKVTKKKQDVKTKGKKRKHGRKHKQKKEKKSKGKHAKKEKSIKESVAMISASSESEEGDDSSTSHSFGESQGEQPAYVHEQWAHPHYEARRPFASSPRVSPDWYDRYTPRFRQGGFGIVENKKLPPSYEVKVPQNGSLLPESPGREFSEENVGIIDAPRGSQIMGASAYHSHSEGDRIFDSLYSGPSDVLSKFKMPTRIPEAVNQTPMEERKGPSSDLAHTASNTVPSTQQPIVSTPDISNKTDVNKDEQNSTALSSQALIETLVKSVLTEMLTSLRMERNQSSFLDAVGKKLEPTMGAAPHENVTVTLVNALKKGKALEKIDTLLTVLYKTKGVKNGSGNQSKANEVVTDVLKVMHDILGTRKSNQQLDIFKKRITKFMEGSSNATKRLIEKLLKDLEPTDGRDRSSDTITDAISVISAIFGQHKRPRTHLKVALKEGLGNLFNIPREWNILLPGPDGSGIVVPYRTSTDVFSGLKPVNDLTQSVEKQIANLTGQIKADFLTKNTHGSEHGVSQNISSNEKASNLTLTSSPHAANASLNSTDRSYSNNTGSVNQTEEMTGDDKLNEERKLEEKIAEEKQMVEKIAEERLLAEKIAEEKKIQERKLEEKKAGESHYSGSKGEEKMQPKKIDDKFESKVWKKEEEEKSSGSKAEGGPLENRKLEDKVTKETVVNAKQLIVSEGTDISTLKKETPGEDSLSYNERHPNEELLAQNVGRMGAKGNTDVLGQENLETVRPEEVGKVIGDESQSPLDSKGYIDSFTMESNKLSDADIDTTVVRSEKLNEPAGEGNSKDDGGLIDVEVVFDPKEHMSKKKNSVLRSHHIKAATKQDAKLRHDQSKNLEPFSDEGDLDVRESSKHHDPGTFIPKTFTFNVDEASSNPVPDFSSNYMDEESFSKTLAQGQYIDVPYQDSEPEFKNRIPSRHNIKSHSLIKDRHRHLKPGILQPKHIGKKGKTRTTRHRNRNKESQNVGPPDFPVPYYKDGLPGLRERLVRDGHKADAEDPSSEMMEMDMSNSLPFVSVPLPPHDYNLLTSLISYPDSLVPEYMAANAIEQEPRLVERDVYVPDGFRQEVRRSFIEYPDSQTDTDDDGGRSKRDLVLPDYVLDRGNSTVFEEHLSDGPENDKTGIEDTVASGEGRGVTSYGTRKKEKRNASSIFLRLPKQHHAENGNKDKDIGSVTSGVERGVVISTNDAIGKNKGNKVKHSSEVVMSSEGSIDRDHVRRDSNALGENFNTRSFGNESNVPFLRRLSNRSTGSAVRKRRTRRSVDEEPSLNDPVPKIPAVEKVKRRHRRSIEGPNASSFLVRQKRDNDDGVDLDDDGVSESEPHVVKRSAILSELEPEFQDLRKQDDAHRIKRRASEATDDNLWDNSRLSRENEDDLSDRRESSVLENDDNYKTMDAIGSLAKEVKAGRRSNVRRVASLEGALKRRLLAMRKESGTVLNILRRVHHDISTGNAEDLRDLEIEMAAVEDDDIRRQNLRRPRSNPAKRKHEKARTAKRKKGKAHKKSTSKGIKVQISQAFTNSNNPYKDDTSYKLNPEEYYKYGPGNSGILEQWTLVFYGT